jgi:hypothetical protein
VRQPARAFSLNQCLQGFAHKRGLFLKARERLGLGQELIVKS